MTQKDYIAVASMLKSELEEIEKLRVHANQDREAFAKRHQTTIIANRMANIFANDNPRFKREVFMRACGLEAS